MQKDYMHMQHVWRDYVQTGQVDHCVQLFIWTHWTEGDATYKTGFRCNQYIALKQQPAWCTCHQLPSVALYDPHSEVCAEVEYQTTTSRLHSLLFAVLIRRHRTEQPHSRGDPARIQQPASQHWSTLSACVLYKLSKAQTILVVFLMHHVWDTSDTEEST